MYTFPLLFNKLGNGAIWASPWLEATPILLSPTWKERRDHAFTRDSFTLVGCNPEKVGENAFRSFEVGHGNAEVFNFVHMSGATKGAKLALADDSTESGVEIDVVIAHSPA